jgi:antitoxin ParD1/3/4
MSTMNVSLPESLKSFMDERVTVRGYDTSSEYVRDLIARMRIVSNCAAC